jgi:glyoxylase-like metal-dependent hydrolase (beta-lactamase superfamily II)
MRPRLFLLLATGFVARFACAQAALPAPQREITKIAGDLYRARNRIWYSLFLVTADGIILVDPLTTDFSAWLKTEFDRRFPGVPVRYVIYSHSHWDHIEGGALFASTARFIAQEGVLRNMDGRIPHMPGDMIDRNHNGQLELDEIVGPFKAHPGICGMPESFFHSHDRDHDGHMTPAELYAEVRPPDIVYSERMQIVLGGKTVKLIFPGRNHANDGSVLLFPAERVAFAADFPADALAGSSLRSLPSACGNFDGHPLGEWIKSYKAIEDLDFDLLAGGHGSALFTKADIAEARHYFEDLIAAVSSGMAQGQSLDELKRTIHLEKYQDWAFYSRLREDNIEAAYINLITYR